MMQRQVHGFAVQLRSPRTISPLYNFQVRLLQRTLEDEFCNQARYSNALLSSLHIVLDNIHPKRELSARHRRRPHKTTNTVLAFLYRRCRQVKTLYINAMMMTTTLGIRLDQQKIDLSLQVLGPH